MRKQKKVAYPNPNDPTLPPPSSYSYLIVDIGGGTVDISAHRVSTRPSLSVQELHHPDGNVYGGLQVNTQFSRFLQEMVEDPGFSRYNITTNVMHRFDFDELINRTFEGKKEHYCRNLTEEKVQLPDTFLGLYRDKLEASLVAQARQLRSEGRDEEIVSLKENKLTIPPARMEQFIQPAVTGVFELIDHFRTVLSRGGNGVDALYLVGGFGGSRYMYRAFRERYGAKALVFVPPHPEFAVVDGAVLFRRDPTVVRSRKADATYGKSVVRYFERFHDERYRKGEFTRNLFQTIVGMDEDIKPDCFYLVTSRPLTPDQPRMYLEVSLM